MHYSSKYLGRVRLLTLSSHPKWPPAAILSKKIKKKLRIDLKWPKCNRKWFSDIQNGHRRPFCQKWQGLRPRHKCCSVSLPPPPISTLSTTIQYATNNDAYICKYMFFKMNYMSMGIGRHYIIKYDITTKLHIVHYGYVVEVIVKYGANTWQIELDRAGQIASNNDILIKWSGQLY